MSALVILSIILTLTHIFDLPHLLFGTPSMPVNWAEMGIDMYAAFLIGLIAIALIRQVKSKRKKMEETLPESEDKFGDLFENANDLIQSVDANGRFVYVNKKWLKTLRYSKEELGRLKLTDILRKDQIPHCLEIFKKVCSGEPFEKVETVFVSKDGREIAVEGNVNAKIKDGKFIATIGIFRDITKRKKAEEEIEAERKKLETYVESMVDGVCVNDINGTITQANNAYAEMHGYKSPKDVVGKPIFEFIAKKELPRVAKSLAENMKKRELVIKNFEVISRRKDGEEFPVMLNARLLLDKKGKSAGFISMLRDITEQKKAEEKIKLFSDAVAGAYDCFLLTDMKGNITYANESAVKVFGYQFEEFRKMNAIQLNPDPNTAKKMTEELIKNGKWSGEIISMRKNKEEFPVMISASLIKDEKGKPIGMMGIFRDITERKKAEEELGIKDNAIKSSISAIAIADVEENLTYVNPSFLKIWGYDDNKEVLGRSAIEFWQMGEKAAEVIQALQEKGDWFGEFVGKKKDGTFFDVQVSANMVKDKANRPIGMMASFVDITQRKRAEQALKESEKRYRILVETAQEGISITDPDENIIFVNQAFADLLGYKREELLVLNLKKISDKDGFDKFREETKKRAKGESSRYETRLYHKSSEPKYFSVSATPMFDDKGTFVGSLGMLADISERKKAEETLRFQSEIAANMSEGVYVIRASDGIIVYTNPKFEEIFGYGPGEMIGKHVSIVNAPTDKSPQETAEEIIGFLNKKGYWRGEIKNIKKDGTPFWCYAGVSIFDHPEHGTVWITIHTDITERKQAEEALRESERKFRLIFENAKDAIFWADTETGLIINCNKSAEILLEKKREEIVGSHQTILHPPQKAEYYVKMFKTHLKQKGAVDDEAEIITKSGKIKSVHISASVTVVRGKPIIHGIFRDITQRKQLQQQLIQSEKLVAVGTLAYGIAHEFNNILAGMLGNAEFGRIAKEPEDIKESFDGIVDACQRAKSITTNLLVFARQKEAKKEIIDIIQPLKSVLAITKRELEKANIKIVEEFKSSPKIFCDPGQFSEVFLNMVTNARDAMRPEGGIMTIRVESQNDNIRTIFKDTGCGIPDHIKGRIFEPFVTTKGALGKSEIPGTGLGLFLTYGIVDGYQGKIEVESEVGKGTEFTILIPISKNLPREPLMDTVIEPSREIQAKLNILLVDDEKPICITLKRFLESKGHKVTTSLRADEGLKFFKKDKFDVVLSDITMPDMDGIELIQRIKKKDKKAKIIVMTGHILKEKEEQARDAGADEVLVKPFKNDLLYQTIAKMIL